MWVVMFTRILDGRSSRPTTIVCSSYEILQRHVCEVIARNLKPFDKIWKDRLVSKLEAKNYDEAILVWRKAQERNSKTLGFDMWWDPEPQVVL